MDDKLPEVEGAMEGSIANLERACRVLIKEEQEKVSPNNTLIAVLCNSVRMGREYVCYMEHSHTIGGGGMIAIVNIGPYNDPDPSGVRDYEVRINRDVVATFQHRRADGLAVCLRHAAAAVERSRGGLLEVAPPEEDE